LIDLGFAYRIHKSGEISIDRHGQRVTILRGSAAARFLKSIETGDPQQVMARATGNYKRGNERASKPRDL
jgi:hypothetical protein